GFLDALGVAAAQIPEAVPAQAALYRSLLAGKRVLVVLDNARDPGQVRPLLPGSPGCLVIVTSRSDLAGLVAAEGAYPLSLDLLPPAEAGDLLARRLGQARVAAEPHAVAEIIERCARLPLALSIAAARAPARGRAPPRPVFPPAGAGGPPARPPRRAAPVRQQRPAPPRGGGFLLPLPTPHRPRTPAVPPAGAPPRPRHPPPRRSQPRRGS